MTNEQCVHCGHVNTSAERNCAGCGAMRARNSKAKSSWLTWVMLIIGVLVISALAIRAYLNPTYDAWDDNGMERMITRMPTFADQQRLLSRHQPIRMRRTYMA